MLEEVGVLFKNDPTFDFIFNKLPKGMFTDIMERRKKRLEKEPPSIPLA